MADNQSSSGQTFPVNSATILALLTAVGAYMAISNTLSSDRPVTEAGKRNGELSEQQIDTRLWEDPFAGLDKLDILEKEVGTNVILGHLLSDMEQRKSKGMQLLPVMIPGGPSSEDREFRLRSRFSIVSALAESGFAPQRPEQIGIQEMFWYSTLELNLHTNSPLCPCAFLTNNGFIQTNNEINLTNVKPDTNNTCSRKLVYTYEWYVKEPFARHQAVSSAYTNNAVLVLWLDEDSFYDKPIKRLDLFLKTLIPDDLSANWSPRITFIGPYLSSTLRNMFPSEFETSGSHSCDYHPGPLTNASLFLALPRAIDEVIFTNVPSDATSRSIVTNRLTSSNYFHEAKNFAATDTDLAREVIKELKSRGIDLTNPGKDHVVLLADWDNFFGRMVSTAYAAELACQQTNSLSRSDFLAKYRSTGGRSAPTNLHTFFYYSGLDGERLSRNPDADAHKNDDNYRAPSEDNPSDRRHKWTPDINIAEGPAQFDYLGRLADQIGDLQQQLRDEKRGTVSAIGIAGGDVYDTLLILQALKPRFPNAVFFTSTLDARFWAPKELAWTRNLVVVSAYGLELNWHYQGDVPPFRSSLQTAQFITALAALGNTNLLNLTDLPIQRCEIGNNGPVDLRDPPPPVAAADPLWPLHPEPPATLKFSTWFRDDHHAVLLIAALITFLLLAYALSKYFRRLTFERSQFLAEPLWLAEEDIGGLNGFLEIARKVNDPVWQQETSLIEWLKKKLENAKVKIPGDSNPNTTYEASLNSLLLPDSKTKEADRKKALEKPEARAVVQVMLQEFLAEWNKVLCKEHRGNDETSTSNAGSDLPAGASTENDWLPQSITNRRHLDRMVANRRKADELIEKLLGPDPHAEQPIQIILPGSGRPSQRGRSVGDSTNCTAFNSCSPQFPQFFWACSGWQCLLSVSNILRTNSLASLAQMFGLPYGSVSSLSSSALSFSPSRTSASCATILATTRRCRLCYEHHPKCHCPSQPQTVTWRILRRTREAIKQWIRSMTLPPTCQRLHALVEANQAWSEYQQKGNGQRRFWRSLGLAAAYFVLICTAPDIFSGDDGIPHIRGDANRIWYVAVVMIAFLLALFLSFWTIDAARLCGWFIQCISQGPTIYPQATRQYFAQLRGNVPEHILADWIDVQIIAEITERVGRLIYFPVIAFSLLLLAHNTRLYNWSWPAAAYVIAGCNLVVAVASIIILQHAARRARDISAANLESKLHELKVGTDVTSADTKRRSVDEAQGLLNEIKGLNTGAFAGFWGNPVVGALLLPTGGTALIGLISYFMLHR